ECFEPRRALACGSAVGIDVPGSATVDCDFLGILEHRLRSTAGGAAKVFTRQMDDNRIAINTDCLSSAGPLPCPERHKITADATAKVEHRLASRNLKAPGLIGGNLVIGRLLERFAREEPLAGMLKLGRGTTAQFDLFEDQMH